MGSSKQCDEGETGMASWEADLSGGEGQKGVANTGELVKQRGEGNPVFLPFPYVSLIASYLTGWLRKSARLGTLSHPGQA